MTVGLLGGTFDPVHQGHLDVARAAQTALALDEVWLIPARHPPHRDVPVASAAHRFAMVGLAIADQPDLRVCDAEMDRTTPSFTIDTLERLGTRLAPAAGATCFITGADAFLEIRTWHRWRELLDRCAFAVVSRPGCRAPQLRDALPELAADMRDAPCGLTAGPGIFLIDDRTADVSSTRVRRALNSGRALPGLVPDLVTDYAVRHGLYAAPKTEETLKG